MSLYEKYGTATMVGSDQFADNIALAERAFGQTSEDGIVIECGCWKAGMIAAVAEAAGARKVYAFDGFNGLPEPTWFDGPEAFAYQKKEGDIDYRDNCRCDAKDARETLDKCGANWLLVEGDLHDTLDRFRPDPISLLRIDVDWYSATSLCLRRLWQHMLPEGIVILDDYFVWQGCSRAVHNFLAEQCATERISSTPSGVAYIVRRADGRY